MISLTDLKYFLNITGNTQDEFLLNIIDMSTARINNLCRRDINYGSRYDILDGAGENILWLANYPVHEIQWIHCRKSTGSFDIDLFGGQTVAGNTYIDRPTGKLILLNNNYLPEGASNVQIKYFAGYTSDAPVQECELPSDLKSVCLMMSSELFLKSYQSKITYQDESGGRLGLESAGSTFHYKFRDEDYTALLQKYKSLRM